jgi:hypothetical protein
MISHSETDKKFIFGLDLGQQHDYTALVILERMQTSITELANTSRDQHVSQPKDWKEKTTYEPALYHCRYLERMRNIPYPVMVERVKRVIENPEIGNKYMLVLDQTGVGRPIYDLFKQAGLATFGVSITGGNKDSAVSRTEAHVAKSNLVAAVQVVAQTDRLKYAANLADLELLRNEIATFRVHVTKNANETYEAREGQHDDLILALAIGLWFGEKCGTPRPVASTFARH